MIEVSVFTDETNFGNFLENALTNKLLENNSTEIFHYSKKTAWYFLNSYPADNYVAQNILNKAKPGNEEMQILSSILMIKKAL